jgi:nucleotide-binding universal stress UspA family protein
LFTKIKIMKTILVPTDFSEAAKNAAEYAINLAKVLNTKVTLFHVYHVPLPISEVPIMVSARARSAGRARGPRPSRAESTA